MLKYIGWTTIATGVLLLVFAVAGSSSYQQCSADADKSSGDKQQIESSSKFVSPSVVWRCTGHFIDKNEPAITAVATVVIAIFTIVLAFVTNRQARLTRESIDLARAEFVATHRPKIIVRFIQGPWFETIGEKNFQYVWITIANVGESDATVDAIGADLARKLSLPSGHEDEWSEPGLDASPEPVKAIVLTSGERHTFKVVAKRPFTDREIFEDAQGTHKLCVVGVIKYTDSRKLMRETGFYRTLKSNGFIPSRNKEDEYQD